MSKDPERGDRLERIARLLVRGFLRVISGGARALVLVVVLGVLFGGSIESLEIGDTAGRIVVALFATALLAGGIYLRYRERERRRWAERLERAIGAKRGLYSKLELKALTGIFDTLSSPSASQDLRQLVVGASLGYIAESHRILSEQHGRVRFELGVVRRVEGGFEVTDAIGDFATSLQRGQLAGDDLAVTLCGRINGSGFGGGEVYCEALHDGEQLFVLSSVPLDDIDLESLEKQVRYLDLALLTVRLRAAVSVR